jgi:hypothetical protein
MEILLAQLLKPYALDQGFNFSRVGGESFVVVRTHAYRVILSAKILLHSAVHPAARKYTNSYSSHASFQKRHFSIPSQILVTDGFFYIW